jgi:fructokinase
MSIKYNGAVELGGTKTVALVAKDKDHIVAKKVIPTLSPEQTVQDLADFFHLVQEKYNIAIDSIGIGSFGPLDLNPDSETYGFITSTPKKGWVFFNIKSAVENACQVDVIIDTDVNAAALGEYLYDPEKSIQNLVYITIGTGIGAGLVINNRIIHGLVHPEFGHMRITHNREQDPFSGVCPYHHDCLEGLASGPAIEERWNTRPQNLPKDHPAWQLEAEYISYGLVNLICTVSPELIILGGGVMNNKNLYDFIRVHTKKILSGYIKTSALEDKIDKYIIAPRLNADSGIIGALYLVEQPQMRK